MTPNQLQYLCVLGCQRVKFSGIPAGKIFKGQVTRIKIISKCLNWSELFQNAALSASEIVAIPGGFKATRPEGAMGAIMGLLGAILP
jgi:hypothetical protein